MGIPKIDLSRDEIVFLIEQFVFNKRDRDLIYERLIDGLTISELSSKYSLSDSQVKVIIRKTRDIVFSHAYRLPKR